MTNSVPGQPSDRRQLQQIIAGSSEGVILVEPDHRIAWANEAALAMHGVDTLAALGADVTEYRQRFAHRGRNNRRLKKGNHPVDRVLAGEEFNNLVVEVSRTGQAEPKWVHRVRSLALTDGSGAPDCLVLIIHDATEQFEAEERFESSFNANPAPAVICRIADRLYVRVNPGFLEISGFGRADVIGHCLSEIDFLATADRKDLALEHFVDGRPIPQMEAQLPIQGGRTKSVIVAGQPIQLGDEKCMLFTFVDLDPRKEAEAALRQTEMRAYAEYEAIYTEAPVALHSLDADGRVISVSNFWLELLGYRREDVVGHPILEFMSEGSVHNHCESNWPELLTTGSVRNAEYQFLKKSGTVIEAVVSARIQHDAAGSFVRTMEVLTDITERKRSEERFVKAFRLAPVPMIVCQLIGFEIIDANQAFLTMVGRPPEDVVGHGSDELRLWEHSALREQFERELIGGRTVRNLDAKVQTAAGTLVECLVSAELVSIAAQPCALVVMQDVTDRRRSEAQLFEAIEAVMHDTSWFSRTIIEKLADLRHPHGGMNKVSGLSDLTGREREVLGLVSLGLSDVDIMEKLNLSRSTVRNNITAIFGKIGVHSRSSAIVWARERGFTGGRAGSVEKTSSRSRTS
jgi:PAS domain S-box-containing protein